MERRGCARAFARPPLRSAASPGTGGREGPMEGKIARGLLRALPLRRRCSQAKACLLHVCGVGLQSRCSNSAGWRILLAATGMGWLRGVVAVEWVVGLWQFVRRVARAQVGAQSVRKRSWLGRPARASSSRLFALFARLSLIRFPLARHVLQGLRSWDCNRDGVRRVARPPGGFSVAGRQPGRLGYSAGDSGLVGLVAPGLRGRGQL